MSDNHLHCMHHNDFPFSFAAVYVVVSVLITVLLMCIRESLGKSSDSRTENEELLENMDMDSSSSSDSDSSI